MTKKEISVALTTLLKNSAGFTGVVGTRLFALVAPKDTQYPFAVYSVGTPDPLTKDGGESFPVAVTALFAENGGYLQALDFETVLRGIFDETDFEVTGCETYRDPDMPQIVMEMSLVIIN